MFFGMRLQPESENPPCRSYLGLVYEFRGGSSDFDVLRAYSICCIELSGHEL